MARDQGSGATGSVVKRQASEPERRYGSEKKQRRTSHGPTAATAAAATAGFRVVGRNGVSEGASGKHAEARPRDTSPADAATFLPAAPPADRDSEGGTPEEAGPVRLFLGGLPGDAVESELRGLLSAFGEVLSVEIVPPKSDAWVPPSGPGSDARCRGFAYVSLQPKSLKELRRCLSLVSPWGSCIQCC